jgi:uncharacterized membrane protein
VFIGLAAAVKLTPLAFVPSLVLIGRRRAALTSIATFVGCAPLRGLPQELYAVPRGWSNFTLNYSLPG